MIDEGTVHRGGHYRQLSPIQATQPLLGARRRLGEKVARTATGRYHPDLDQYEMVAMNDF